MLKKLSFLFALVTFLLVSCASTSGISKPEVSKRSDSMFWEINGTDSNGEPSTVYILGTIHVGDEKLYPMPAYITDAFKQADVVCGEISSEGWLAYQGDLTAKMVKSLRAEPDKQLTNYLTDEELEFLALALPPEQYNTIMMFDPWVANQILSSFLLVTCDLQAQKGYDVTLISTCNSAGIHMEGLDELSTQLDIIDYGSFNYQLNELKVTLEALMGLKENNAVQDLYDLYNAYLSHNEAILEEVYIGQLKADIATSKFSSEKKTLYNKLLKERNADWAKKINNYLKKGGKTFIFAGVGHFVGEDSVFSLMRKKGYIN